MTKTGAYNKVVSINVDVQNDFCPEGALAVTNGDLVVPPLNAVNRWVRAQNGEVIFTADWHPRQTAHFAEFGGPWPPHCIRHTAGAAFHDDLMVEDIDSIARKGMGDIDDGYSGWFAQLDPGSPLRRSGELLAGGGGITTPDVKKVGEAILDRDMGRRTAVIIGGLATDYCVKATVLDALTSKAEAQTRGINLGIYVVRDAIQAVDINKGDGEDAIAEMTAAGAVLLTSKEILDGALQVA